MKRMEYALETKYQPMFGRQKEWTHDDGETFTNKRKAIRLCKLMMKSGYRERVVGRAIGSKAWKQVFPEK